MRADRLVAILLTLQVHGQMTAASLAQLLEASERTIRRDLEALCVAGVPLYSQRGRGGGWSILGNHRLDLTGFTVEEAQAFFLATGPGSGPPMGPRAGKGLEAARRKVLAALPPPLQAQVEIATKAVLIDQSRWGHAEASDSSAEESTGNDAQLRVLQYAVLEGVRVVISYEPPGRPAQDRRVQPLGLVCKRGVWYLVAMAPAELRTYRLSRVRSVTVTEEAVERPSGFDLPREWSGILQRMAASAPTRVDVRVVLPAEGLRRLRAMVGAWWPIEEAGLAHDGRAQVSIGFPSIARAAAELCGLGDDAEVVSPQEVRAELAERGKQLMARYCKPASFAPVDSLEVKV